MQLCSVVQLPVVVALPLVALVIDLPRSLPRRHRLCPSRLSRVGWLLFRRGWGGYRCGHVCEPSCLRVCHRCALLVFSGPTHRIRVVVVRSLALI